MFQPSVAAQFRQAVADIILIAYHHEDDAREDEDRGGDVRGVEMRLSARNGQDARDHGLDVAVERRVHRGQLLRAAVEQVHGQDGSQNEDIAQFGLRKQRKPQKRYVVDVFPEEGRRYGQPDDVVPPHHDQRAQLLQLRLDNHRIDGDGHHGRQHEQVALGAAAVGKREAVAENQDSGADECADHPHDTRPDILARVHQVIHDQREGRAERGDDRGVDGRGVRRPPEQHVHPAVDDQQRDNQNVARIAPRNAVGVAGEKGERNEENRRRKHLQHEYLLKIEVIAREGDVERKIRSEKHIGENQVEIIARFTHKKKTGQLSHRILPYICPGQKPGFKGGGRNRDSETDRRPPRFRTPLLERATKDGQRKTERTCGPVGRQHRLGTQRPDRQKRTLVRGQPRRGQPLRVERLPHGGRGAAVLDGLAAAAPRTGRPARHRAAAPGLRLRHPAQPDAVPVGAVAHLAHRHVDHRHGGPRADDGAGDAVPARADHVAEGRGRLSGMRRGADPDSREPARHRTLVERHGRRAVHRQRRQLRHLPHGLPQRDRPLLARDDDEVDVPLCRHSRRGDLLPSADRGRLRRAGAPDLGRNRLRRGLLHVPLLPDGSHRPAPPAAHGRVDVQLRAARRGGAVHRGDRTRHLRIHQGRSRAVRLRGGMAGNQVEIPGAARRRPPERRQLAPPRRRQPPLPRP